MKLKSILTLGLCGFLTGCGGMFIDDFADTSPPPRFQAWPVDRRVNNARNESPDLIEPAGKLL